MRLGHNVMRRKGTRMGIQCDLNTIGWGAQLNDTERDGDGDTMGAGHNGAGAQLNVTERDGMGIHLERGIT